MSRALTVRRPNTRALEQLRGAHLSGAPTQGPPEGGARTRWTEQPRAIAPFVGEVGTHGPVSTAPAASRT